MENSDMSWTESKKDFAELALMDCRRFGDPMLFETALARVDDTRREKIRQCGTSVERQLSLGVGLLGDMLLRRHGFGGLILFAPDGRPFLPEGTAHISLSHGGYYAMAGVSTTPLGVDVESVREEERAIVRHYFAPAEQCFLEDSDDRHRDFWRIWCRKECLVKRDGLIELRQLSVVDDPAKGKFWEFPLSGHICVCLTATDIEPRFRVCSMEELDL